MHGALPPSALRLRSDGNRAVAERFEPRPPGAGEVVVDVVGSAIGRAPGAEITGVVVAAAEGAADWLGKRVVVPRLLPCGECERCRCARVAHCKNAARRDGVATCETVPARYLVALEPPLLPSGVELWRLAALADAAAAPHAALARAGVAPGDLVVVLGAGVAGRFALRLAGLCGAHLALLPISDGDDGAQAAARRLGDDVALVEGPATAADRLQRLRALGRDRGAAASSLTLIETSGRAEARRQAIELAALAGGTAVLLDGGDGRPVACDLEALATGEARIIGAGAAHPDLLPELLSLVVRGELRLDDEVAPLPFPAAGEAVDTARASGLLPVLVREAAAIDTGGSARS